MIPFTKTIGFRLWLACAIAIIAPLGINIIWLNLDQYRSTVTSISNALRENAAFKANTLTQIVPLNIDVLSLFSDVLDLDAGIPDTPNVPLSNEMKKVFQGTYDEISLVKIFPNGNKIVVASSVPECLGENYNHKIDIPEGSSFLAALKQSAKNHEIFSVMQANLFDRKTQELQGVLYTTFSAENLLKDLLINKQDYLTVKTAILSKHGVILKASDPALYLHTVYPDVTKEEFCQVFLNDDPCPINLELSSLTLSPLEIGKNFYSFKIKNKEVWGCIEDVPNIDIAVLSYAKKEESFAPLWRRARMYTAYFFCVLLGSFIAFIVAKRLSLPIRKLATAMIESRKHINHPYTDDSLGFEINRLGHIFNAMVANLHKQQDLAKANFAIKESAQNALLLGEQAQQRLLPNTLPSYPHIELAKAYIPAITVGGDFFDVFVIGEGMASRLFLIVADASGKGVNACGYSLFLKNMLRTFLSSCSSLQEAIQKTSYLFYNNTKSSGMFVTLCVYCYHQAHNTMEYYSCGHPPACYLKPNGDTSLLFHPGMALGFLPEVSHINSKSFQPEPGSLFILYSDGITEAHNSSNEMFGDERLQSCIQTLKGKSAADAMQNLMLSVKTFVGNSHQHDDITLLVLKVLES
ncbi:Phosphoserine phosphatase rsbU,stage II sporulation protein E,Stage II sporulation protein E (SpoIIE) [Chlamydia serpentis]|uniref:Phosphoserine phosphatase rsbU,stage II sporulation protein E,Stage II sporulation protein E (SpoIIE) n=1 Tax=Chlamydia serpentis TaxID=1967782 RepID=A0A2R8FCB7_9CHLA|nr:PP2C family protein-serine/threonine phosphatase [Chlamydia serpentis]SPN73907.1 Phosphoserine phosphatase rsbU,stage II sporulation protein E,Stage II sporulation protein E (SpoIIE) [Chlamydia serpentis]